MKKDLPTRKLCLATLIALVALGLAAVAGPASAGKSKNKNRLAGSWTGTTEEGNTVSFRITKGGRVLNFSGVVNLLYLQGEGSSSHCPTPGLQATVNAPVPVKLSKPVPGYPKGKRFQYSGPGGSPPSLVASFTGKVTKRFAHLEGNMILSGTPTPAGDLCRSSAVSWDAKKVGGRK